MEDAIKDRMKRKMRKAKVLIQSQFVTEKPKALEDLDNSDARSMRSIRKIDDSTLSQRLSYIPKERASTVLSSLDDSKLQMLKN